MAKWGKWDREKWEVCPKLSHCSPIFLPFPTNFTHFFYTPHTVLLAISQNPNNFPPFPPISAHPPPFPPISPSFPLFPFFFTSAHWLIRLRLTPMPAIPKAVPIPKTHADIQGHRHALDPPPKARALALQVSLGAFGDSAFEYLLKLWVLNDDALALGMFNAAKRGIREKMLQTNAKGTYVGRLHGSTPGNEVEHLTCFAGGMFAMAYHYAGGDEEDLRIAERMAAFCHAMYAMSPTGLAPDVVAVSGDRLSSRNGKYILRPETVETYFYLWRITHNAKYRDWGWEVCSGIHLLRRFVCNPK